MRKILQWNIVVVLMLFTSVAWSQTRVVSGKVTSADDGTPTPGVNVVQKGTTNGTTTDGDGNFKLAVPEDGGVLVFSFIGMATQEVAIAENAVIDVQLKFDIRQLSEIVVTGTGVATEKKKLAIAVETVTADKLPAAPAADSVKATAVKLPAKLIASK